AVLADPLDQSLGVHLSGPRVDELVLERGRSGVDDEDHGGLRCRRAHCGPPAWRAVIATVLTMSRTRAPRERSLTGLPRPWRTGPIATAEALRWTALYV